MKIKAFTLAEIMIVLTIIGVITAILLPIAISSAPDENIMKFKKANNTLGTAIRELVNSDEYYLNGDLATKADGTIVDSETYFCETLVDVLNTKEHNCSKLSTVYPESRISYLNTYGENNDMYGVSGKTMKQAVDDSCRSSDAGKIREIVTPDDVVFYQVWPNSHFGMRKDSGGTCPAGVSDCKALIFHVKTSDGFLQNYTVLCIDVDGVPESATVDDCVNECPFGYALRVDGKLIPGKRADEWMAKSMQKGD